ncbi:hypothetical protein BLA29_010977, partial [Euroglyphus maynei]
PIDKQNTVVKQNEEFILSNSPIIFGTRRAAAAGGGGGEHVSICSDLNEIHHGGSRVHSPLPSSDLQQHNELLAEMKAIQEKRSYNSTPVSNEQLTFESILENKSNVEQHVDLDKQSILHQHQHSLDDNTTTTNNSSSSISVAKRATIFGDLHKSPSKHSISSPTEENNEIVGTKENQSQSQNTKSITTPTSSRQRPKSMVGMLGAKFELSLMNTNANK